MSKTKVGYESNGTDFQSFNQSRYEKTFQQRVRPEHFERHEGELGCWEQVAKVKKIN